MKFTMKFCPPNITFSDIWINNGTSECTFDTITAASLTIFVFIFGSAQLWMYKKHGSRRIQVRSSKLYSLQIYTSLLLILLTLVKYCLLATVINFKTPFLYHIISASCLVFALGLSTYLTFIERNYVLPTTPSHGHGLVLLLFWTFLLIFANLTFVNLKRSDWWFQLRNKDEKIDMYLFVIYYVGSLILFVLGLKAPGMSSYYNLGSEGGYGINNLDTQRLVNEEQSTWSNVYVKIRTLFPYLWPHKNLLLKIQVLLCFLILILGRIINLYVPIYNRLLVNSMIDIPLVFHWDYVLIYVGFKFLQGGGTGGMGLLNNIRSYLWIGIQQYTTREIELGLFKHLHTLSLRWHLSRKTGEVITIMNRGTDSVTNLLNYILFQIIPTIVDIIVAITYFVSYFNIWYGLIVFITMTLYLVTSIVITEWRTKFQRRLNLANNALKSQSIDSLLNFETVKYYSGEEFEVNAYKDCILNAQKEEWKNACSLVFLNFIQNVIITGGLLAGSLFCVHQVVNEKTLTVGDYTLFASYILQLYVPLNWFGTYYRGIQKNFVNMENMFDLMNEKCEVVDAPDAATICITQGSVQFKNVFFSYTPERNILENISFFVPAGKTLALVGHSGSGKSTIMRLIFRFYDPDSGEILIDNQNIRYVTQSSLRKAIGVVPQDTVLFNSTLQFNIGYGKLGSSDADIIEAAKSADIHNRIVNFPDSYKTQVGERGLKLSGGEKQRVAIARTMLKLPEIVLLDEATSALDTKTERNIQSALQRVCANRTTIIVAHRLSTIIHADEILVLSEGEIIERGQHEELLSMNGVYSSMWTQQNTRETLDKPEATSTL